ncbi:Rha family transcriptional regulator [Serratia sp. JSRIV002]|uniref:Rha family transcriptional regulator n=1 Tax=Serratia sp. JSRIV002 TaxID=2831894 RepID=UPI001CC1B8CE|nr:Rha family transcriptional regulator [Serratia sp. JSRIV002]UAN52201.1 Rha family transcriptional regulator [Serratia sp. JSRIV002]UAN52900.1 Rha family transcriptional regulator [Serratia sp. JSRIV002]
MKQVTVIPKFDFKQMVMAIHGKVVTTSVLVAKHFNKRHKNVIRAIRELKCSEQFKRLNFEPADFIDKNGEIQPMYNMTKDGCIFLIMGFTGEAAAAVKESYINAFNWMAEQLTRWQSMGEEAQQRHAIKAARSEVKGRFGSRLMHERKKEKRVLNLEYEQILSLTQPRLIIE